MEAESDLVDFGKVARVVGRRRRWIAIGGVSGLLLAILLTFIMDPRYEADATVLLQSPSALPGLPDLDSFGTMATVLGGMTPGFETELQILTSRTVLDLVIDSLSLQAQVRKPTGVAAVSLLRDISVPAGFEDEKVRAVREAGAFLLTAGSGTATAAPGSAVELPSGVRFTLQGGSLPDEFEVLIVSRSEAIEQLRDDLSVEEPGGEVVKLTYQSKSPETAAAVPNAMFEHYFTRRRGHDRGANQRRYDFLLERTDSIAAELAVAERSLRMFQEATGVLDPALNGEMDFERAMQLETEQETLGIEARTLREIMEAGAQGEIPIRSLAAYPTFLRNPAINALLEQLLLTESERIQLLEGRYRTELDPEVVGLSMTIDQLEAQLVALSSAYLAGVERQAAQVGQELQRQRAILATLPQSAEESYRLQRDVRLHSEMLAAMQAQQLQARLGTIAEGGDVRLLDPAIAPDEPSSPSLVKNVAFGLFGGVLIGVLLALGTGYFGRRIEDEVDVELSTGVRAVALKKGTPLILSGGRAEGGVLVAPVGDATSVASVARGLADTAALRGSRVSLVQFASASAARNHIASPTDGAFEAGYTPESEIPIIVAEPQDTDLRGVRDTMQLLEERFDFVVAALPQIDSSIATALLMPPRAAVLVVMAKRTRRAELRRSIALLRGLDIPILGAVVVDDGA